MEHGAKHSEPAAQAEPSKTSAQVSDTKDSLLHTMHDWLKQALGSKQDASLKEALEEVIEEHEEQADERLMPEEKAMLHNVLEFGDRTVSDIMIPRPDIIAVPHDITLPQLKAHIIEQRHTRIPVYEDTLDHVQGFIHVKDLISMFSGDKPFDIKAAMRGILFVPPSMPLIDLLVKMRNVGSHMAIVVDEHGGTDGLATMEDVMEELVGDIQDEHDDDEVPEDKVSRIHDRAYEVSARIHIEKLEQKLGLNLITEENGSEFDTLGGLIFFKLGRVPLKGEVIPHENGVRFEIADADARRIHKVRILTP